MRSLRWLSSPLSSSCKPLCLPAESGVKLLRQQLFLLSLLLLQPLNRASKGVDIFVQARQLLLRLAQLAAGFGNDFSALQLIQQPAALLLL